MMSTNNVGYNEQAGDAQPEVGQEAAPTTASTAFGLFSSDAKKNEDLKQMLESSKDSAKLEAMKRIVGMIARGKNASELFPAVVKNVASKSIEVEDKGISLRGR
ncbi:AP-3 complex subunit beta-1 [Python bivittatus]|uniref:AP-3 complex subunit beta-1 n=1 Tax=Python bivittatus TaxID=176946 RepID=A0A9F2R2H1_PYTBI|nr:AP-3 complex subunit beta-1 [Python bivittatus]